MCKSFLQIFSEYLSYCLFMQITVFPKTGTVNTSPCGRLGLLIGSLFIQKLRMVGCMLWMSIECFICLHMCSVTGKLELSDRRKQGERISSTQKIRLHKQRNLLSFLFKIQIALFSIEATTIHLVSSLRRAACANSSKITLLRFHSGLKGKSKSWESKKIKFSTRFEGIQSKVNPEIQWCKTVILHV